MPQLFPTPQMVGTATFSECGTYRYDLTRTWDSGPRALFIMLNPSTATAEVLDPTVRRCLGFSRAWGMGSLVVLNLFALRSTDPKALLTHPDPVGPENDATIRRYVEAQGDMPVVAAWGVHGTLGERDEQVRQLVADAGVTVLCLGRTRGGHPRHPLYLKSSQGRERL